ncbi:unnamed protein product [Phyllotreta striolata]|uniref:Uncharacterized protein n=1 Tax=Phyllotreta striolata TaxID=444603 RepID=A0A9N9XQ53_PHYSR|nr:unnamed protein product [Phyllotreta striolata]
MVWMLLIAAFTTQALQIAGILESPKGLQEITYNNDKEYSFQLSVGGENRGKRETAERSKFIDSFFNKQYNQGEYFFRIDRTNVITAIM